MPRKRPAIPAKIERTVRTRAGHRCSVDGETSAHELAHIIDWAESEDHSAENLLLLCANCHTRSHAEKWDRKTLQYYRDHPWVSRDRSFERRIQNLRYISLGDDFVGREDTLVTLRQHLTSSQATALRGQAIHGMGGVGKTCAATEYAWRFAGAYRALLFVEADSPLSLQTNLAALCGPRVLDLPAQHQTDLEKQHQAVLRWLETHSDWLLILDNADTPEAVTAAEALLPSLREGHVLLTTRQQNLPIGFTPVPLGVLAPEAAIRFLLQRTRGLRSVTPDDEALAADIAHHLDGIALALEQAAAYIRARRCSFADYLKDWESKRAHVLSWHDPEKSHYPRSIAITYETSLAQLTDDARTLFRRLSWLAPDPLPVQHLKEIKDLPDPRALLIALTDLHLATLSPDGTNFTVHRLLQEITRQQQPEEKPAALLSALSWVNGLFLGNPTNPDTWPLLSPLAPHATALAHFADARHIVTPTGHLFNQVALFYKTKAQHQTAEPLYRRAADLSENKGGPPDPAYPCALSNLAQLLKATNRLAEAEPLMRRALALDEASLGKDHPKVAIRLNNLAQLLLDTNRLAEAEPLMRRALDIDEATLGKDHPNIATDLNILAQLLHDTNRLAEAEPLIRRALDIDEASFGKDHPEVATDLNNLAQLLHDTNRLEEAEPLMRRALAIGEAALGKDHPDVAIRLNNLAQLLQATSRLAEAEPLMRRALAIGEACFGTDHPKVAIRLNNLSQLLQDMNRLAEAEPLMRRTLAIDEASFGKDHPEVATDLNMLATLLQDTNRLAEAEPLMRRAVGTFLCFTVQTGHRHPDLETVIENYRFLLAEMGDPEAVIEEKLGKLLAPLGRE